MGTREDQGPPGGAGLEVQSTPARNLPRGQTKGLGPVFPSDGRVHCLSPIDLVLSRLEGARRAGRGWIARCPAHRDRDPSLSLAEAENGTVLLHCFAQCSALHVVNALGLSLSDLFVRRPPNGASTQGRFMSRAKLMAARRAAALAGLELELTIVVIACQQAREGTALSETDQRRLLAAAERVAEAREVFRAG